MNPLKKLKEHDNDINAIWRNLGRIERDAFGESKTDPLENYSLKIRLERIENSIDIHGNGAGELIGIIKAILDYLDVYLSSEMIEDPHYPKPEPKLMRIIKLKPRKISRKK